MRTRADGEQEGIRGKVVDTSGSLLMISLNGNARVSVHLQLDEAIGHGPGEQEQVEGTSSGVGGGGRKASWGVAVPPPSRLI
jgi:hypothetical protein